MFACAETCPATTSHAHVYFDDLCPLFLKTPIVCTKTSINLIQNNRNALTMIFSIYKRCFFSSFFVLFLLFIPVIYMYVKAKRKKKKKKKNISKGLEDMYSSIAERANQNKVELQVNLDSYIVIYV